MGTATDAIRQDLEDLTISAIASLNRASEDLVSWVDLVRDAERPWALGWSKESCGAPMWGDQLHPPGSGLLRRAGPGSHA